VEGELLEGEVERGGEVLWGLSIKDRYAVGTGGVEGQGGFMYVHTGNVAYAKRFLGFGHGGRRGWLTLVRRFEEVAEVIWQVIAFVQMCVAPRYRVIEHAICWWKLT
jgi:hypothetical protein